MPPFSTYQARIETYLHTLLLDNDTPNRLAQAMQYSCLGGGKRIRALLVYAGAQAVNAPIQAGLSSVDYVAAALESVHAYSLIHDDLPAMDDDDMRRGKPSNHKQFDEATAILAGDGLLTFAFELIHHPDNQLNSEQSKNIGYLLARAAGKNGMVGGQILDIFANDTLNSASELENIHRRKTGALIEAAIVAGALCEPNVQKQDLQRLKDFASSLGLAFQVVDDILDVEGSSTQMGKSIGSDQAQHKATYPALLGLKESKQIVQKLYQHSIANLEFFSNTKLLHELAQFIIQRQH